MRADQKLVSIIIPTFNRANLIADTLISIKNQTHTNWECIIVDDGSIDNTEAVVNTYIKDDARFKFYKRPDHRPKGANACRNFGFERSKGQFINWFDSDDTMDPKKLEIQVLKLVDSQNSPYCICQTQWIDKKTNTVLGLRSKAITSNNRFEDYLLYQIFWSILAPVWRRNFIEENQLRFDENLHQSQEYDFHLKALSIDSNYAVIDVPLATMYKHTNNISNNIYANNLKIESNIAVKAKIVNHYFNRLSAKGKMKCLEILTLLFKDLLLEKKTNYAQDLRPLIFKAANTIKMPRLKRYIFYLRLHVALLSYRVSGKGYSLVKPIST